MAGKSQPRSRGDETRERLFAAAVRLFAEHGYADTTVDRVVREAGVAKGTFFIYFATKDAVITELVRIQVSVARRARERVLASGGSPVDAVRAAVMTLGEQAAVDRQVSRAVITANILSPALGGFAESLFDALVAELVADVRSAQRAKLLNPKVEAERVAETLITSYWGALLHFATAPHSRPLLDLLSPVVEANLAGFGAAPLAPKPRPRAPRSPQAKRTKSNAPQAKHAKSKSRHAKRAESKPRPPTRKR